MTKERLVAIFLNNQAEMIDILIVSDGIVNSTGFSARKVAEAAFARNASFIVLAHNHPDGDSRPSEEDITLTKAFVTTFKNIELPLVEHIVVGGSGYTGILTNESSGTKYANLIDNY
jgi:DNA repair protein RadC